MDGPRERVERSWRWRYGGLTLDEVEPSSIPGYWRKKQPCRGRGECSNPLHSTLLNEGPVHHTVTYFDPPRDEHGRFASRTRTWSTLVEEQA